MRRILIRGTADIGSAVAHRLFVAGHAVVLHDDAQPTTTRRKMAFTDAIFDGGTTLDGVGAVRVDDASALHPLLTAHRAIPVCVIELASLLRTVVPHILVDARMRKHSHPEPQCGLAPLTIGLGPNFVAGVTTDLVVETAWGDHLGRVSTDGQTLPLAGEPREIAGHARDRYVYAPVGGTFRTAATIGDLVRAESIVAHVGEVPLHAPLDGTLRGLVRDSVPVAAGTKVIEVDPRGPGAVVTGLGERPTKIAAGVLEAVYAWVARQSDPL